MNSMVIWVLAALCATQNVSAYPLRQRRTHTIALRRYAAPSMFPVIHSTRSCRSLSHTVRSTLSRRQLTPDFAAEILGGATSTIPGFVQSILLTSTFWSVAIMLSLVFLLYAWEESVATAREKIGPTFTPVVDSMLAEMGGLGFIGLFLSVVVTGGPLGGIVGALSERFLGDEEILLETFEFLHTAFFEVGIGFFVIAGLTVAKVLSKIASLADFSRTLFERDSQGNVSLEELADELQVPSVEVDFNRDGELSQDEIQQAVRTSKKDSPWDEISITVDKIRAEGLVVRERMLRTGRVSPDFRVENYCETIFGRNLKEMVELSPLTWLPLIPTLSLGRSIDMSHDVVSAASSNAAESCGFFLGSPVYFWETTVIAAATLIWGCFNFWKVAEIKIMLIPTLLRDSTSGNKATLLPPRFQDESLLAEFNSSPSIFGWFEGFYSEPARNDHEALFGVAGAAGP